MWACSSCEPDGASHAAASERRSLRSPGGPVSAQPCRAAPTAVAVPKERARADASSASSVARSRSPSASAASLWAQSTEDNATSANDPTNGEIARALVLTTRTVETHLGHRGPDIDSRTEPRPGRSAHPNPERRSPWSSPDAGTRAAARQSPHGGRAWRDRARGARVDLDAGPIAGSLGSACGPSRGSSGWIGLVAALRAARAEVAQRREPAPEGWRRLTRGRCPRPRERRPELASRCARGRPRPHEIPKFVVGPRCQGGAGGLGSRPSGVWDVDRAIGRGVR